MLEEATEGGPIMQQSVEEFFAQVADVWAKSQGRARYGQVLFNELYRVRPDLADRIRGTNIDPFYKHGPSDVAPEVYDLILDELGAGAGVELI